MPISYWPIGLLPVLRTLSQIVMAGVAITAFSLLLYALTFNLRDRVASSFTLILMCVVIMYTAESVGSASMPTWVDFWQRVEWIGVILLPATYLHFSDALLATTGKPSRGKRSVTNVIAYLISFGFIVGLPFTDFYHIHFFEQQSIFYFNPSALIVPAYFMTGISMSWYNFIRAFRRAKTSTSRRRMAYLLLGSLAPLFASIPYILFGSTFSGDHSVFFWLLVIVSTLMAAILIISMAYAVAFFGVSWPDRVVRSRLFKWILRGPVSASLVLGATTVIRRFGDIFGAPYSAPVPITMVVTTLLCQYLINIFSPYWEKWMFFDRDHSTFELLHRLEDRLMTQTDLAQFFELILAAVCDRLQATGACLAVFEEGKIETVVATGKYRFDEDEAGDLYRMFMDSDERYDLFRRDEQVYIPLIVEEEKIELLGLLCIDGMAGKELDEEQQHALNLLTQRVLLVLNDRRQQQKIFTSLKNISPESELLQIVRAAGRYDERNLLEGEIPAQPEDMPHWVKEALTHYWGGPKLTESPLLQLQVVKEALVEHEGNYTNALRAILRQAIEKVRPEGERRFTGEWILYNILEMKFLEGRKVREVAVKLSMSEADLYRKQKVAIEAVADAIMEMENYARNQV
ncbi:MAG: hypothetical protein LWX83_04290 [Anaerolineae bacterium]|nr:hypothetical protein [Anaerolineae bacterium]